MIKFINKNKLLATTAICAISICANTVKAEEISISEILNNSNTKSPNISWEQVTSSGENTIQIGNEYFKYTWTNNDSTRVKYTVSQYFSSNSNIKADFIGIETSSAYGGAIDNGSIVGVTISSITGDFIGNNATGNYYAAGGAIYNGSGGTISSITGDFTGNSVTSTNRNAQGGAIYNSETISSITGDFIGNSATGYYYSNEGGAIYNSGEINFVADGSTDANNLYEQDVLFQDNYTQSRSGDKKYEAVYNSGTINFDSRNGGSYTFYDSIYNTGTINLTGDDNSIFNMYNDIEGWGTFNIKNPYTFDMVNQEANLIDQDYFNIEAASTLNLDVILSTGISDRFGIDEITGANNFTLDKINLVDDMDGIEYEKVVYSNKKLAGNEFTREQSTSKGKYSIVNDGQNLIITKVGESLGFASFLYDVHDEYTDYTYSFTEDENMEHVLIDARDVTGNVQPNGTKITVFGNNHTLSYLSGESSKAMKLKKGQTAEINNLTIKGFDTGLINKGNIVLNNVTLVDNNTGLINNREMTLNNVTLKDNKIALKNEGKFTFKGENIISGSDYAMYFEAPKTYDFSLSGVIYDYDLLFGTYELDFMTYEEYMKKQSEYYSEHLGYPVTITNGAELAKAVGEYYVQQGWYEETTDITILIDHTYNIRNEHYDEIKEVMQKYGQEHPSIGYFAISASGSGISPKKFVEYAYMEEGPEKEAMLEEILADMLLSNDWMTEEDLEWYRENLPNSVSRIYELDVMYEEYGLPSSYEYVAPAYKESTLKFAEGSILNLNSKISGEVAYGLTLAGADDAIINLNSEIEKADLVLDGPTLKLSDESTNLASVNSFEVKNGTLDLQNDAVRTLIASNFKVSGALKLYVDADLANRKMDTLGEVEVLDSASISVDGIKILSDGAEAETLISFAGESYKDKVTTTVDNVLSAKYTYAVEYDATTGEFKFVQGAKKAPEEVAPNQAPALTTTTTAATVETVVAQIFERDVTISTDTNYGVDTTDYMETSDGVNIHNNNSVWVKTFGSDDDVEVDNFNSTIDAEAYGVVGGVDSKVFTYDNGVKAAYGVYGAYVGGKQKYNDSKITQDSGYLGVSAAFRKSNLFSNFTLNGGYITSEANTAWGKDKFDTKVVSVANKTGVDIKTYNNWKITPALYVAYTGMDTEDYTNKAGVKMENEFSNVITIAPEVKVRKGFNNGVGAYAKASYKHYIYDSEVKADDVVLEEMSAKPYVEYGFGVEKNWADKSGYAEITRRSGGREGWNVNLGLNFDF